MDTSHHPPGIKLSFLSRLFSSFLFHLFLFRHSNSSGGGGDLATPTDAAVMITKWKKEGTDAFKFSLLRGNFRKYSAYGVFAFLILLVLDLIVESGTNAFIV